MPLTTSACVSGSVTVTGTITVGASRLDSVSVTFSSAVSLSSTPATVTACGVAQFVELKFNVVGEADAAPLSELTIVTDVGVTGFAISDTISVPFVSSATVSIATFVTIA